MYTNIGMKNVTITLPEKVARWARQQAGKDNTSVSKLVAGMLTNEMKRTDDYWTAYRELMEMSPAEGFDAAKRLTREQAHARR